MSLEKMKKRWGINGNVPDDYEEMVEKGRNAYARESQINELKNHDDIKNSMNNISQKVNKVFHSGNRIEKESIWDKIQNTVKDLGNTVKNIGLGAKSGISQVGNYIENANENNFSNYKNIRNQQFYSNKNVDEITKGNAKTQNNMLINKAKENMSNEDKNILNSIQNNKIEKNLIKDNIQKSIQEDNKKIQENIDNTDNKVLKKINELAPSIGQMGVGMVASAVNPALGVGYFATSAGGSYIDDAKKRGMNDKDAFTYGTIMGAIEGATEEIGIGNFKKAGKGIKALVKGEKVAGKLAVGEISKQSLKTAFKDYGIGIADNTIQEAIIEPIQEIVAGSVGGKEKANWNGMGQRMIESGINGGLVGAIVGGSNLGVSSCVGVVEKINNGQTPTKTEMQQAVKDASKQLDTSKIVLDSVKQTIDKQKNITQQQNQNVVETNVARENKQENQVQNNQTQDNYKNQAIKEIENSHLKSNQKENLIKEIDGIDINEEGLSQIRQIISDESKLDSEATYKTDNNRKRTYMKYKNNTSDYDTQALDLALDSVKENRNGKRTVKQWLEVADKLGQQLADKSNDEIEQIAYRSWNDLQPNTKDAITRYDNRDKVNMPFQKFTSDDWVNTIYNAVNEARNKNSSQQLNIPIQNNTSDVDEGQFAKVKNLENNQNALYNNSNEMESDINGQIQSGRVAEVSGQLNTSIQQNSEQQQKRKYTRKEYEQWENNITPTEESKLTNEQRKLRDEIKRQYNKDIVFFDGNNNYNAGASLSDKNKIYVKTSQLEDFGYNKIALHEVAESNIRFNRDISNDIIQPAIEKIINDPKFEEQKRIFWENQEGDIPSDYAVAKDILCDRFSEIQSKEKLDYKNILSQETNMTIDYALDSFNNKLKNNIQVPIKQKPNLPSKGEEVNKVQFDSENIIENSNKMSDDTVAKILTESDGKTKEKRKITAILKANLIDKGMVFEELSRKTGNRDLQGKYDYTLTAEARGQNAIGNARYDYQTITEDGKIKKGNKNAKQISKSLTDIIDEVGEDPTDFYNYMYHQLNIDRMTLEDRFGGDTGINYERTEEVKNKPVFGNTVTADISRKIVSELEQKHPEFKNYAKDVYDYLDANMQELVNNGVISEELRQRLKERYPHYVPVSRVTDKGQNISVPLDTNRTGVNSPLKRAKGGNQDIKPLFQTMADRTLQTYRASARNNFGVELKNTLQKANQLNQQMESADIDTIIENMADETQNKELLQEGKNGQNPTFTVFENGERVTYEISKDMYDALKPKNELFTKFDNSKLSKGLSGINSFRRGLLTEYNPIFSITNAIKDAQDVLINSQHSAKTYSKIPEATAQILGKGYWYKEYVQNGGEQNSYFRDGDFQTPKNNLPTKAKNVITAPLRGISKVNNIIEMTPRLAEYIVSREQGKSIETAMLDASRVTTNFKAGGDVTKFANRNGATFLNASVQGFQQQVRNIQEANAKGLKGWAVLATKYTIAGLPAMILNNLIWDDDDDYKDLQDYVKDNYYIIGKTKNGTFIRIPKGRAVATIQKIVSNADEFIKNAKINPDKLGQTFWNDLKEDISFASSNLAPNNPLDNNIISPLVQTAQNKTWYGDALVPSRLQDKPKAEQYDESTDEISKWIGKHMNVSPYKVNYLLDQYSGGVGDVLLPKLTPQAENSVLEDKFTSDPVMKSKYAGEFFSKIDELKVANNADKATDNDKVKYKYLSGVQGNISKLYKEKREIQNSNKSDKEKKEQLKNIQSKINKMAKEGMEKAEKIDTKNKNYIKVDNNQYYKDIEGNWKKVEDKDKEKNKEGNISLGTYTSYKNAIEKVKARKVKNGEMKESESLDQKEKIQILLNSKCSNSTKSALYEQYIKSKPKDGDVDIYKALKENGVDINQYLKYVQQEFKSDKKDDGTLNGKSISGSAKSKVYDYINNNISGYENRLLLLGTKYKLNTNERKKVYETINNLPNTTQEEKLKLLNKMKGFTVYKDGTVKF